jgi:betaine reductase
MRVVHYLNQFFGGIGGEEKADSPPEVRQGAVGPGRLLESVLPEGSQVAATIICGDNYAAENLEQVQAMVVEAVQEAKADLLIAGPCFVAGRYGAAAGGVCAAVQDRLGVPAIAAMAQENPGTDLHRSRILIVDSGTGPSAMRDVMAAVASLGQKLVNEGPIGRPAEEGYFPQGILKSEFVEQTAAQRMTGMLLAKMKGLPFQSEAPDNPIEKVTPPEPVKDLSKATIALVTDGGLVPKGNPDRITRAFATVWGAYSIEKQTRDGNIGEGKTGLAGEDYEVAHGGYDNNHVQDDPNRLVPVDVLREMESAGVIAKLSGEFYSTTGNANPLENSHRMGREMAQRLKEANVDAVILTST